MVPISLRFQLSRACWLGDQLESSATMSGARAIEDRAARGHSQHLRVLGESGAWPLGCDCFAF